jgi:formate/nitrite transporter FocA (FNT family)
LVAAIVWMLPQAEAASFFVITAFTWLIAICGFTHVIAGSVEIAFLVIRGEATLTHATFGFFLPTLAGNIVGGTAIFALMASGQVQHELVAEA